LLSLLAKGGVLFLEIPNKDCLDFVAKDGHFLLFGINLLPREEAAAYHEAMTGETGYLGHMGEFHPLSFYTSIISRHGFKHALLDRHITGSAADLPRKREELVAAHDNWEREWGGRLPAGIAENLERKYRVYLQKLDQDVNQRTEAATLVRTYLSSFWSIVVE
jgi:hypothetical protein